MCSGFKELSRLLCYLFVRELESIGIDKEDIRFRYDERSSSQVFGCDIKIRAAEVFRYTDLCVLYGFVR